MTGQIDGNAPGNCLYANSISSDLAVTQLKQISLEYLELQHFAFTVNTTLKKTKEKVSHLP